MAKTGVIFSNLGTPRSAEPKDVASYLREFLMDPYVIQIPGLFRWLLVNGVIAPFRAKKSSANYKEIWTDEGSPLLVETQKAAEELQKVLGDDYQVVVAMRYGQPDFASAKKQLAGCDKIIFFPQYPHYAESSMQTAIDEFHKYFGDKDSEIIEPFFDHPQFIKAYGDYLIEYLKPLDQELVLFSFHGLPEQHIKKLDPTGSHCLQVDNCCANPSPEVLKTCYRAQCYRTAKLLAEHVGLSSEQYSVSFQSRLGRQKWIEPYTDFELPEFVERGIRKLAVVCPGFPVDGLETLEEVAITGRRQFLEAGGRSFYYVPCLNSDHRWIQACAEMVKNT